MGRPRRQRAQLPVLAALLLCAHNGRTADAQEQIAVTTPGATREAGEMYTTIFKYSGAGGEEERYQVYV